MQSASAAATALPATTPGPNYYTPWAGFSAGAVPIGNDVGTSRCGIIQGWGGPAYCYAGPVGDPQGILKNIPILVSAYPQQGCQTVESSWFATDPANLLPYVTFKPQDEFVPYGQDQRTLVSINVAGIPAGTLLQVYVMPSALNWATAQDCTAQPITAADDPPYWESSIIQYYIETTPSPSATLSPSPTPTATAPCEPKPTRGPNVLKEVPVVDKNGNPIIGASHKALMRPDDGQDFQFYATEGLQDHTTLSSIAAFASDISFSAPEYAAEIAGGAAAIAARSEYNQLSNFGQNAPWDEQRVGSINGAITNKDFIDISTVNIGVYGAIVGIPENVMLATEAVYSKTHKSLLPGENSAPSPYSWLGLRNYNNTIIGYNLVSQGTITYKNWLFCFIGPIITLFLKKG